MSKVKLEIINEDILVDFKEEFIKQNAVLKKEIDKQKKDLEKLNNEITTLKNKVQMLEEKVESVDKKNNDVVNIVNNNLTITKCYDIWSKRGCRVKDW